jgi:integrase
MYRSVSITPARPPNGSRRGLWQEHDLVFCREDGTPLDRWHVRKEFQKITKAAQLGEARTPRELRHSFVSILSANDVRSEDISDLVGHSSTSVTRDGLPARDPAGAHQGRDAHEPRSLKAKLPSRLKPCSGKPIGSRVGSRTCKRKVSLTSRDGGI